METGTHEDSPPGSNDLNGWRDAIRDDRLSNFRLESVVAAFQDLGGRDVDVRNALAKHLSKSLLGILRRHVGFHHPNQGNDIILRAHGAIFEALLKPGSADSRGLREAFTPRVLFRLKDALAAEARERRIPDESDGLRTPPAGAAGARSSGNNGAADGGTGDKVAELAYDATPSRKLQEAALNEVDELEEQVNVNRILECITDDRKRLAFHLFMNDVPYKSKRKDVHSIARALGISEKTARKWIKEVRDILAEDESVRQLKKLRAGEQI